MIYREIKKEIVIMYEDEREFREEHTEEISGGIEDSQARPREQYSTDYYYGTQYNRMNMSHIPEEPAKGDKKKGSIAGKVAGITAAALLFGTVAGGTMFGVNTAGEYLRKQYGPKAPA